MFFFFFFFKQKTAYEMRISDWSSDVCSSDLSSLAAGEGLGQVTAAALTGISNLIGDVKAKFANLADGSLTTDQRTVYENDVNQLISQVQNYVNQATYNGKHLLSVDTGNALSLVAAVPGTSLQTGKASL